MAPIFWQFDNVLFNYSPIHALLICFILAVGYVVALYIGVPKNVGRDHPVIIRHRFIRVTAFCLFALPFLWLCSTKSKSVQARPFITWIGIRFDGIIQATSLPLVLTMILFIGPLMLHYLDGVFKLYVDLTYWTSSFRNIVWLRNHVVAPFSEEFIYRACMLPILVPAFGEGWSIVICPMFFGVAHFHHIMESIKHGVPLGKAILSSVFQFCYTTLFGMYSAFLFLRTNHLIAPVVAHAFCNHMGFPNFGEIQGHKVPTCYFVAAAFVLGLGLWCYLLYPLTTPSLFSNDLYNI